VYIQPQPPQSCKPLNVYRKPTVPLEDGTVYKLSYIGTDAATAAECRVRPLRRKDNLSPADHVTSETTYRHDYTCRPEAVPAEHDHRYLQGLFGARGMPSLTTQQYDYTTKPVNRIVNFRRYNNIRPSSSPMDFTTIASASYRPIENCRPAQSCKPQRCYIAPSKPFPKDTVHTLSYMPPGQFLYVGDEEGDSTDQCSSYCQCFSQ
jgi:hypothetical protein